MTSLLSSIAKRSRFLLDWDAAACLAAPEQSLDAITGQAATFARASVKSAYDANGVLRTVPHSMPAFEWSTDPVSGLSVPGLAMEDSRSNLALWSQDFGNAVYSKSGLTVTSLTMTGPDGVVRGNNTVLETATTAEHYIQQQLSGIPDNTTLAWSLSVKPGRQTVYLSFLKKDGVTVVGARFDIVNGTVTGSDAGITPRIRPQANGYYRITVVGSVGAGASQPWIRFQPTNAGTLSYLGSTVVGVYLADAQAEAGAIESSRIITLNTTATRQADAFSLACKILPRAMTVYVKFVDRGSGQNPAAGKGVVDVGGNGTTPRLLLYFNTTSWTVFHSLGPVVGVTPGALGASVELRGVLNENGSVAIGASNNGGAEVTGSDPSPLALEAAWFSPNLYLNQYDAGSIGFASFQRVRIAAGVQSLAFMQAG